MTNKVRTNYMYQYKLSYHNLCHLPEVVCSVGDNLVVVVKFDPGSLESAVGDRCGVVLKFDPGSLDPGVGDSCGVVVKFDPGSLESAVGDS